MRFAPAFVLLASSTLIALAACSVETVSVPAATTTEDGGAATEPTESDPVTPDASAKKKDAGKAPVCQDLGGECEDNKGCCANTPFCAPNGTCCAGEGAKKNGGSCTTGDDCCSGACDTQQYQCCAYEKQDCATSSDCCPGFECGTDKKCGLTVGQSCAGGKACAQGLLCADKVKNLGWGSSTYEPDKCCVPGGYACATSEDCCHESSGITGVQCYQGLCKRSTQSVCTHNDECTYKCENGKCK